MTATDLLETLTTRERLALRPPLRLTVSQWADRYRVLGQDEASRPGHWETDFTPYLRGVMDSFSDPDVRTVVFVAGSQIGKSEGLLNVLGYSMDQDPANTMVVLPNEKTLKYFNGRVTKMVANSPKLAEHMEGRPKKDRTVDAISTDRMSIYFALAGSPADLASRPCKRVLLDEVDKYAQATREAEPVSLARERTKTFHDSTVLLASTPTTRDGIIWGWWEQSDQHRYHVPCPHCGTFQVLDWERVRWPKGVDGDVIARDVLAWYECLSCEERIPEGERRRMVQRGVWCPAGGEVLPDGTVRGGNFSSIRGFQVNALYSPFVTWSECAQEFLKAKDHQNFYNSWLGWVWEEVSDTIKPEAVAKLATGYKRGTVPAGGMVLTAGVDVQANGMYYEVRAWGIGEQSWLVQAGFVTTWDELDRVLFQMRYPDAQGEPMEVSLACIDSGFRTDEVYQFCMDHDAAMAVKGHAGSRGAGMPLRSTIVGQNNSAAHMQAYAGLALTHVDTDHFKTKLMRLMLKEACWHVHENPDEEWLRQMASEHKVRIRRGGRIIETWQTKAGSRQNHYLDCFSSDTEVLTSKGWRELDVCDGFDTYATVNLETLELEYQQATAFTRRPHEGKMIQIGGGKNQRANLLVTHGHRMVIQRAHNKPTEVIEARDLKALHRIPLDVTWTGCDWSTIQVPGTSCMKAVSVDAADLAALMGWYVSEGHKYQRGHHSQPGSVKRGIFISQVKAHTRDVIKELLERLPWSFSEQEKGFCIANAQVFNLVRDLGNSRTMCAPPWLKSASPRIINAFLEAAVLGDGWVCGGVRTIATISKQLADDYCELFIKAGKWASVSQREPQDYDIGGRKGFNTRMQYWVRELSSKRIHLRNSAGKPNFREVDFKGEVACPTVPNGTLIVRRGGKVAVCGNCSTYSLSAAELLRVRDLVDDDALNRPTPEPVRRPDDRRPFNDMRRGTGGWLDRGRRRW